MAEQPQSTFRPGAEFFSDPVALAVQPLSDLAVSFYLPSQVMRAETYHSFADQDNFIANGDMSTAPDLPDATKISSWYFLDGIDVQAVADSRAIVTLGDSITDGALSTHNANLPLARRSGRAAPRRPESKGRFRPQ